MKKVWIIAGIILAFVAVLGGFVIFKKMQPEKENPKPQTTQSSPKPSPKLASWEDPAGFTLQYPENLTLNKHEEDQENYAHLEFTSGEASGSVVVWAKDLPVFKGKAVGSVDDWVTKDPLFKDTASLDTTLGEEPAKKVMLSEGSKIIIGAVYDNVLWYVEGNLTDKDYWQPVVETIAQNFSFKPVEGAAKNSGGSTTSGDSGASVDEEETIE